MLYYRPSCLIVRFVFSQLSLTSMSTCTDFAYDRFCTFATHASLPPEAGYQARLCPRSRLQGASLPQKQVPQKFKDIHLFILIRSKRSSGPKSFVSCSVIQVGHSASPSPQHTPPQHTPPHQFDHFQRSCKTPVSG